MRFEQVKDVLHHVIDFHGALASDYRRLANEAEDERVRLLLRYLAEHENKMRQGLTRYTEGEVHNVLDTWMQNTPNLEQPHVMEELRQCLACTTVEDIAATAERIHETLERLYRELVEASAIDEERELFQSLADFQNAETRRLARNTARMDF